jgi:hypothetical protein
MTFMCVEHFSVRFVEASGASCCPLCGEQQLDARGPRLFQAEHEQPLCRSCSKRLAPNLGALLELSASADRLGRHCRQLLTPPLEVLLDLARAAENYVSATAQARAG